MDDLALFSSVKLIRQNISSADNWRTSFNNRYKHVRWKPSIMHRCSDTRAAREVNSILLNACHARCVAVIATGQRFIQNVSTDDKTVRAKKKRFKPNTERSQLYIVLFIRVTSFRIKTDDTDKCAKLIDLKKK